MTHSTVRTPLILAATLVGWLLLAACNAVLAADSLEIAAADSQPSPSDRTGADSDVDPLIEPPLPQVATEETVEIIPTPTDVEFPSESPIPAEPLLTYELFAPKTVYRRHRQMTTWLPANRDEFEWFSLEADPHLKSTKRHGVTGGMSIHWLNGPIQTDIPPRLYNFHLGLQARKQVSPGFSYDVASSISIASDFEDSARDGIQFPSHAVAFLHSDYEFDIAFGVEYLHRDDIKILPVIGLVLREPELGIRAELVFPRPRIDFQLNSTTTFYVSGELGGGSWDIERPDESNDVMTYRDYRIGIGLNSMDEDGKQSAIELGYVFRRELEFRHLPESLQFDDGFVIRWVSRY